MLIAGVDIGSTTSKAVLIDGAGTVLAFAIIDTKHDRDQSGEEVLALALAAAGKTDADLTLVASTGYGRRSFKRTQKVLPEIVCHARGTEHLYPGVKTIIDVGGQDSKIIAVGERGTVQMFEMNDRCAAGHRPLLRGAQPAPAERAHGGAGAAGAEVDEPGLPEQCLHRLRRVGDHLAPVGRHARGGHRHGHPGVHGQTGGLHRQAGAGSTTWSRSCSPAGSPSTWPPGRAFADQLGKEVVVLEQPQMPAALGVALIALDDWHSAAAG